MRLLVPLLLLLAATSALATSGGDPAGDQRMPFPYDRTDLRCADPSTDVVSTSFRTEADLFVIDIGVVDPAGALSCGTSSSPLVPVPRDERRGILHIYSEGYVCCIGPEANGTYLLLHWIDEDITGSQVFDARLRESTPVTLLKMPGPSGPRFVTPATGTFPSGHPYALREAVQGYGCLESIAGDALMVGLGNFARVRAIDTLGFGSHAAPTTC